MVVLLASLGNALGNDEGITGTNLQFVILGEHGEIVRDGIGQVAAPVTIGSKQALALVSVVGTGRGDFYNLLEINRANDWNQSPRLANLEKNLDLTQRGTCFLWKLPIPSGFVFLIESDERGRPIQFGQFRCFPATDPSAMFKTVPKRNFLVVAMHLDGTYKESRRLRIQELQTSVDWPKLPAAEVKEEIILRIIESHKKEENSPIDSQEKTKAEQAGTGQPATRPESKLEGSDKPQSETEGRSR